VGVGTGRPVCGPTPPQAVVRVPTARRTVAQIGSLVTSKQRRPSDPVTSPPLVHFGLVDRETRAADGHNAAPVMAP